MPGRRSESVRERAVLALLTFPNLKTAARKAGVGVRTLKRWLAEPDFQADYQQARRRYLETALGRLQKGAGKAVSRLIRLVDSPDAKVARMQSRLEPMQKVFAGGCHLTRPIDDDIRGAGFTIDHLDTYYLAGEPKSMGYTFEGRATPN